MTLRRGYLLLAFLFSLTVVCGCSDEDVPVTPVVPEPLPFPETPDKLMQNFQTIYESLDYASLVRMMHPDYVTILQESTANNFPTLGATLDVAEEQRIGERMFSRQDVLDPVGALVPGIQTIAFQTFARQGSWTLSPAQDPIPNVPSALYEVVILFDRGQLNETLKVQGAIRFYVTPRDSVVAGVTKPYYRMIGQVDLTADQKSAAAGSSGVEPDSWGRIKAIFR